MTHPIDINPDHLNMVSDILHKHLPSNTKIWVFGSRAKWETTDASDLDLAIENIKPIDHKTMTALDVAFDDSNLPYTVDVVDLKNVSDNFKKIINAQKVLLFKDKTSLDVTSRDNPVYLNNMITVTRGRSYKSSELQENTECALVTLKSFARGGGYRRDGLKPYIGPFSTEQIIRPNDIVIAQTDITQNADVIGRPAIVPMDTNYSTLVASLDAAIIRVIDKSQLDSNYLYYLLLSNEYVNHIKSFVTGTTVLHLSRNAISTFQFSLPPLKEQQTISHILKTLDDKIEINRQMNKMLEEMTRTLFKSWFVNFEPVRAKMDGRWKRGQSLPGLPSTAYDLFPDTLVDSELGMIPEGWSIKPLDEIADFRNGLALQNHRPEKNEDRLPVLKIAQLRNGYTDGKEWSKKSIASECIINNGDVVFSWSGSLLVKVWCGGRAALNQHLFKVTSHNYPKWFYLLWLNIHLKQFQSIAKDKATTMGHIQRHHLSEVKCVIPSNDFLYAINDVFEHSLERWIQNNIQSNLLINLRDTILPKLMSGKIKVNRGGKITK